MTKGKAALSDNLEICVARQTVRCRGKEIRLPDLSFRLLRLLSERAPEPVSFAEIERGVWNAHTSRETIKQRAKMLRDVLAELGVADGGVQSARNVGYRLTRALDAYEPSHGVAAPSKTARIMAIAMVLTVGLCVLAVYLARSGDQTAATAVVFSVRSDAENAPQSRLPAWTDARQVLATGLSKMANVRVVASGRGPPADLLVTMDRVPDGASEDLALELLEAETGVLLWSETYGLDQDGYDKPISDFVANVHKQVAALGLRPQAQDLASDEWRRAWRLYVSASSGAKSDNEADLVAARSRLDAALRLRPGFALARSLRARIDAGLVIGYGRDRGVALRALAEVQSLVDANPDIPEFRRSLAATQIAVGDLPAALDNLERAQRNLPFLRSEVMALRRRLGLEVL